MSTLPLPTTEPLLVSRSSEAASMHAHQAKEEEDRRLAFSSVAAQGEMDRCCRRLTALGGCLPRGTSLAAPSLPVASKHSSRVSASGSVTVSRRMRE